jgi:hypothetical protein
MIKLFKQQSASSVLGLALDGNRLEAVVLRRNNGTLQIRQTLAVSLALSPLTGDPELVGREIRNHLDQAGIRERHCAFCIPLSWILTMQSKLPDLAEADLDGFLQIEAERGFPSGHESLFIANSRFSSPDGGHYATLLGVPRSHIDNLERALRAAKLKPATFAMGASVLPGGDPKSSQPSLTLSMGGSTIDFLVAGGGGIIAVRSFDGAIEAEGSQKRISSEAIAREIRITLGQLPGGFRMAGSKMTVLGRGEMVRKFVDDISPRLQAMGIKVELLDCSSNEQFDKALPPEISTSLALALAAARVRGASSNPELLPPKVHPWQQLLTTKLSPKKLAYAGATVGGVAFCVVVAFGIQQWQISSLQSQWDKMKPTVTDLDTSQQQIRKYRAWSDETFRGLRILTNLVQAFPADGQVAAKTLEIRDLTTVTCSGTAHDQQSFLRLLDQLHSSSNEVSDVKVDQIRGQSPLQFTLNYQWEGGQSHGN